MMRPPASALASLIILALAVPARAQPAQPKRSIAVLEFRAGAAGARRIGSRAAAILRARTSHQIVDSDDARRAIAKVDQELAACAGQAGCIAAIGARLGVDEVIVVGVSELGDLILALQRVDSRTGQVLSRVADSLPRDREPDDAAVEQYLRRLLPREDFLRWGILRIDSDVAGAEVRIGGERKGVTPLAPIPLQAPATVDLRVVKKGHTDFIARIDVLPDATVEVRPVLTRRPGSSWYEKPWVWAIAGALVAGGVATAIIVAQPAPNTVPVDVSF
jgi:hypothetical protein